MYVGAKIASCINWYTIREVKFSKHILEGFLTSLACLKKEDYTRLGFVLRYF